MIMTETDTLLNTKNHRVSICINAIQKLINSNSLSFPKINSTYQKSPSIFNQLWNLWQVDFFLHTGQKRKKIVLLSKAK